MQSWQLQSRWISRCSLQVFFLTFPDPPITSVSISFTLHAIQRQGWNSMASTGGRSWDREPGTSRSAAPAPGHPSPGAATHCGATAALWAGNLHVGKPAAAKGQGNSQASHQEYKRNKIKGLKKLIDLLSTSQMLWYQGLCAALHHT